MSYHVSNFKARKVVQLISLHMEPPVGVAVGNLWLVWLVTFTLQPMEHTNHKFPTATVTGVPCEVKSTVERTTCLF